MKTRNYDREEFLAARKTYVGGSDIASVMNAGRYACSRKLAYDKLGFPKDVDDDDRMEFRRGHRLEAIAADFYEEVTGRKTWVTTKISVPGRPHLSVNIDRLTAKKEDPESKNPGYLEIKVVGRHSWFKIKKEGLIDDYILQVQYGCAVADLSWGCYAVYCPDLDELATWDVEADKELGNHLLEAADDWWSFHVGCRVLPEPLPEDSPQCSGCPWEITCRNRLPQKAGDEIIHRHDLEPMIAKFLEVKGMKSESEDAADSLREEILQKIGRKAGKYQFGKYSATFTVAEQRRFSGEELRKRDPALYESLKKTNVIETLKVKE